MFDTSILASRIHDNVMDICVNAIVCEAFLNAVPISKKDRSQGLTHGLRSYAVESMKDLGGHKLLLEACENARLNETKRSYLKQLKSICMEAADIVTERIVEENKDDPEALSTAASNVNLTPEECEKIAKRAEDTCPKLLSDLIQTKVLDTIKTEKAAYKRDAELETEIKAAITTTSDDDVDIGEDGTAEVPDSNVDEAYESYMKSIAGHDYRDHHATLFSRIHELCYESILCATETYTEIPFKTMGLLTKECTFNKFKSSRNRSPLTCLESMTYFALESLSTPDTAATDEAQNTALLTASIIYTFFETLHSMNLFCPGMDEIRTLVDTNVRLQSKIALDRNIFVTAINDIVSASYDALRRARTVPEVEIIDKNLEMVREKCNHSDAIESDLGMLNERFNDIQTAIDTKRDYLVDKLRPVMATESEMNLMKRTRDTIKFSRVASSFGRKPNVTSLRCKVDPQGDDNMRKYIAIECLDPRGEYVGGTSVVLERALEAAELPSYVEASIRGSNLMSLDKHIMITDRRNGKVYMDESSKR